MLSPRDIAVQGLGYGALHTALHGMVGIAVPGGAGGRRHRQRYVVEIDEELYDVDSHAEALELLERVREQARELADKAIRRAGKATKRQARKVVSDARRALQPPELVASPDLQYMVDDILAQIRAIYDDAMLSVQIAAEMARWDMVIERDDEEVLLLL